MINILTAINSKPSTAIWATLQGLETQSLRDDYKTNMKTYGVYDMVSKVCYGCAATAAIQEIAGVNLDRTNIETVEERALALGFDIKELTAFEEAIDGARAGRLRLLGYFCDVDLNNTSDALLGFVTTSFPPTLSSYDLAKSTAILKEAHRLLLADGY
jgi:hypothetical protein